ncbi:MAG: oligosaccharide flippase family protein [Patescibacteria group bacterium]
MPKQNHSFLKKFIGGEASFGFWDSVSKVIGLVNTFFIITALSLYQYGVFQLLLSVYAIFSNFLALGGGVVSNDILRFIGEGREDKAKKLFFEYNWIRIVASLLAATFLFFTPEVLARWYASDAVAFVRLLAGLLLLELAYSIFKSILSYRLQFGLVASRATLYKFAQLGILAFFFLTHRLGVREVIYSMMFGSIVSTFILIRPILRSYGKWRGLPMFKENIIFWVFKNHGKWEIFQQFTAKLTASLQPWIIKTFVNTEAVAIFSIAQTMAITIVGFYPTKTLGTLMPLKVNEPAQMQKIYNYAAKYLFLLAIVMAIGAAVAGPAAVYLFFPKYIPSLPYFFVLLLYLPINALSSTTSIFLVALRRQRDLFFQKVFKAITAIPMFFLVMFFGLWGMTASHLIFAFTLFCTAYIFLRRVPPGFTLEWRNFFRFGAEDKIFARKFRTEILLFLKKKITFINS